MGIDRKASLPFDILLACPHGLRSDQLTVDLRSTYDRVPHPDFQLEASVCSVSPFSSPSCVSCMSITWNLHWVQTWEQRLAAQPSLFNGTKFRYGGHHFVDPTEICLHLGLTDYATFVGTNLNPGWSRFKVAGDNADVASCHFANPLGNAAVVTTSDHRILLLQRSTQVGEFPNCSVFPGGHSEPSEAGIRGHSGGEGAAVATNERAAAEMFAGIVREVAEETGVPMSCLSGVLFLGIISRRQNSRPVAVFRMSCSLTLRQVVDLYEGAEHAYESTGVRGIAAEELEGESGKMPGCHQGGAHLFQMALDHQVASQNLTL